MAFDARYRETQRGGFGSGAASTEPQPPVETENGAGAALQELEEELVKFKGCIDGIGTQFDDHENRKEMKRLRSVIKAKVTAVQGNLKAAKKSPESDKIVLDRQHTQLETGISRFQALLDEEKQALKDNPLTSGDSPISRNDDNGEAALVVDPKQSQVQRMGGLEDREEEAEDLQQLETDILDLREIHKEMADLVGEQGEDVGRIEKHVSAAAVRVETGTKQTATAVLLKKKATRKKIIIVAIIIAAITIASLVLIILLAIVFSS